MLGYEAIPPRDLSLITCLGTIKYWYLWKRKQIYLHVHSLLQGLNIMF